MRTWRPSKLLDLLFHLIGMALLILLCTRISFIFKPVGVFITTLFTPIMIAGFLYYVLNPVILLLEKLTKKRSYAIALVFVMIALIFGLLIGTIFPNLIGQFMELTKAMPEFVSRQQENLAEWLNRLAFDIDVQRYWSELSVSSNQILNATVNGLTTSVGTVISVLSRSVLLIITVPIILFYMFKDGQRFPEAVSLFVPKAYQQPAKELLGRVNTALSAYISGQALVCLYVAAGAYLTFKLLGIPYAFLLACIAGMMDVIPYLGPWIGVTPAFIIAFSMSPQKAVILAISIILIQLGESYLVYPLVMGKSLNMHPLTIILALLVAGKLAGLPGMILALPTYVIAKIIILNGLHYRREKQLLKLPKEKEKQPS
ncbi:AI-2E family transporter [Vagococcus sp. BWB3-3]|uniref:AI-2E family transporter n=1 Tax=Vagococcus allomyrinae TaxID=2794353 RepID=A0A940PAT7_9ENTE|nr:AI-2E family transporter [Vagococcus allomyrinae]MBP1044195.1 AI-2E family transporter [Vagococcus allomyrinae]